MKSTRKVWASLVTLMAACLLQAADSKVPARVISILEVETEDPSGYATWIAEYNKIAKARLGVDTYLRVFQSQLDGTKSARVRVSTAGKSAAEVMKHSEALQSDPAIRELVDHLRPIRQLGGRTLYQAVRFDGTDKGAWIFSTLAVVNDEAGYLQSLDQLRTILDGAGLRDAKINVYRIIAGRTNHSHRINIVLPSSERLAAFLDFVGTNAKGAEWVASAAKFRTVVANGTSREITK